MTSLEEQLLGYLAVRRALGYKLARAEKLLTQFLGWLEDWGRPAEARRRGVGLMLSSPDSAAPTSIAVWWLTAGAKDHSVLTRERYNMSVNTMEAGIPPPGDGLAPIRPSANASHVTIWPTLRIA